MAQETGRDKRGRTGYGSTYRKGSNRDLEKGTEIGTVLGGQTWLVKPDKRAESSHPCLWMQAGVVEFKNCNNFYDCTTCKYDLGMLKRVEKNQQICWQDAMRKRPSLERICRHSLTNRIDKRVCAYDYECSVCDFDQFFEDTWTTKTRTMPNEVQSVRGFQIPEGYYFHNGHTWARIESGGYIRVGMDDFALKLLGTPDILELPLMGKELDHDRVGWDFKRKDNFAGVLSPVYGVVVETNSGLRENPAVANQDPYGGGWLLMVHSPDVKGSIKNLMHGSATEEWMNKEVDTLEVMIEEVAGPLTADGGYLSEDIYGNLPGLGWASLIKTFLKT